MAYLIQNKTTFGVTTLLATALTFSTAVMAGEGDEDFSRVKMVHKGQGAETKAGDTDALPTELAPWMQRLPEDLRTLEIQSEILKHLPHDKWDRSEVLRNIVDGISLFKEALNSDSVWIPETFTSQIREAVIQLFATTTRPWGIKSIQESITPVPEEERAPILLKLLNYKKCFSSSSHLFSLFPLLHLFPAYQHDEAVLHLEELLKGNKPVHRLTKEPLMANFTDMDEGLRLPFLQRVIPQISNLPTHTRVHIVNAVMQILSDDLLQEGALESLVSILSHVENNNRNSNMPRNFLKAFLQLPAAKRPMVSLAMNGGENVKPATLLAALKALQVVPEGALTEELVRNVITVLNKCGGRHLFFLQGALEQPHRAQALRKAATSQTKEEVDSTLRKYSLQGRRQKNGESVSDTFFSWGFPKTSPHRPADRRPTTFLSREKEKTSIVLNASPDVPEDALTKELVRKIFEEAEEEAEEAADARQAAIFATAKELGIPTAPGAIQRDEDTGLATGINLTQHDGTSENTPTGDFDGPN